MVAFESGGCEFILTGVGFVCAGCRNRGGREGAHGYILCLLRGRLHHAAPDEVRCHAGGEDAAARRYGVVGKHRMDRRQVRTRLLVLSSCVVAGWGCCCVEFAGSSVRSGGADV